MASHPHRRPLLPILFLFAVPMILPSTGHGQDVASFPAEAAESWEEVAAFFLETAENQGVIGGALWLVRDGEPLAREFHGMADLAQDRPVDEETIFHWASNTKTLTGIATLQLRDQGLLELDDPATRWIPELRRVHSPYGDAEEITVRHLLSHSAGFRVSTWPWGGQEDWHPFEPTRWSELAAMMPWTEVEFEPGSRYGYSNPGIVFLARIVEEASGEPWEAYVQKRILNPLGMDRSYFRHTPPHLAASRSNAYRVEDGEVTPRGPDFDPGITVSNSGLNAPIPDLVRYLAFLSGSLDAQVLAPSSLEEMWESHHAVGGDAAWGEPHEEVGLTFFLTTHPGGRLVGHTGRQWNHLSFFYLDPDTGVGAIGVVNTDEAPGPDRVLNALDFINQVRARLVDQVFPLFD